jgi:hypothetical protein
MPLSAPCPAAAARQEVFIAGTEPAGACVVQNGRVVATDTLPADSVTVDIPLPDSLLPESLALPPDSLPRPKK